jgi:hypothetical protein
MARKPWAIKDETETAATHAGRADVRPVLAAAVVAAIILLIVVSAFVVG